MPEVTICRGASFDAATRATLEKAIQGAKTPLSKNEMENVAIVEASLEKGEKVSSYRWSKFLKSLAEHGVAVPKEVKLENSKRPTMCALLAKQETPPDPASPYAEQIKAKWGVDPKKLGAVMPSDVNPADSISPPIDFPGLIFNGEFRSLVMVGFDKDNNDKAAYTKLMTQLARDGWKPYSKDPATGVAEFRMPIMVDGQQVQGILKVIMTRDLPVDPNKTDGSLDPMQAKKILWDLMSWASVIDFHGHAGHGSGLIYGPGDAKLEIHKDYFPKAERPKVFLYAACESEEHYEKSLREIMGDMCTFLSTTRDSPFTYDWSSRMFSFIVDGLKAGAAKNWGHWSIDKLVKKISDYVTSLLWDGDTTKGDLKQSHVTSDTSQEPRGFETKEQLLYALANGTLFEHLRAVRGGVDIPGKLLPESLLDETEDIMRGLLRAVALAPTGKDRKEWLERLLNAVDDLEQLTVNCKDNVKQFRLGGKYGGWDDDAEKPAFFTHLVELAATYRPYAEQFSVDPQRAEALSRQLIRQWQAEARA